MTKEIVIPPGDRGDEILKDLLPRLHEVATGNQKERPEDSE